MQTEKEMAGCHVDSLLSSVQRGIAVNGTFRRRRWLTQPAAVVLRRKVTTGENCVGKETRGEGEEKTRSRGGLGT